MKPNRQFASARGKFGLCVRVAASALLLPLVFACRPALAGQAAVSVEIAPGTYLFRHSGYQSLFVVDPAGVVVTDPISPAAAKAYREEIRKITPAPVRYVVYSHHHYDHIAGGAAFTADNPVYVAHRNAGAQLKRLGNPDIVLPTRLVDDHTVLEVGAQRLELHYLGRNHSDNSLVIAATRQKVIYAADWLGIREVVWRNIFDSYVDEWLEGIDRALALDWERIATGHTRQHNPKGWGTKDDIREYKQYLLDLKEATRIAHAQGKCIDAAMQEVKLPQYESWFRYNEFFPMNVERFCLYWRNGWQ